MFWYSRKRIGTGLRAAIRGCAVWGGADGGTGGAARVAARRACADEYLKRWKVKFHKGKFLIGNI